ncbi:MAG: uncharacterized protein KVP18_004510 [Porospora cf. gigantea A]|uniref:uncharacterized protein n=1 Tax=Porospora cf. gigantea A TaxID=2853593 RepID=UPI00355A12EB|nr:MAG: hypothetical protein KVP18_004510 [Porospora cf. gigantea A]
MSLSPVFFEEDPITKFPSVDVLNRLILTWDFYRDVTDDRNTSIEDTTTLVNKSIAIVYQGLRRAARDASNLSSGQSSPYDEPPPTLTLQKLKVFYKTCEEYILSLFPIFLTEAKQSIQRSKECEMSAPEQIAQSWAKPSGVTTSIEFVRDQTSAVRYGHQDLVVIYLDTPSGHESEYDADGVEHHDGMETVETDMEDGESAMDPRRDHPYHLLAVVESVTWQTLTLQVVVYNALPDFPGHERDFNRMVNVANAIAETTTWNIARIAGMNTIHREYVALMSIPKIPLASHITLVSGRKRAQQEQLVVPPALQEVFGDRYNQSQLEALDACRQLQGITLIQGPPGTGKTTTIIGIVSLILASDVAPKRGNTTKRAAKGFKGHCGACRLMSASDRCLGCGGVVTPVHALPVPSFLSDNPGCQKFLRAQPWLSGRTHHWQDDTGLDTENLEDAWAYGKASSIGEANVIHLENLKDPDQPERVLVCAPSNAAIDEIVKRMVASVDGGGGLWNREGSKYTPNIVRVGPNVHSDLAAYGLEGKISSRLSLAGTSLAKRDAIRTSLLRESRVVCSTLSMAGSRDIVNFADGFDTVVIDEASQGVELATLIPLTRGCRRLILVGDPKQLPATVFSRVACDLTYEQSLFQRLEKSGLHNVQMLSIQYRMHPEISAFPSKQFYDGTLHDAPNINELTQVPVDVWRDIPIFKPVVFFNVDSTEHKLSQSYVNNDEADLCCQLIELLWMVFPEIMGSPREDLGWCSRVAIISPYAEQVRMIRGLLKTVLGVPQGHHCPVDVNTVDGFQGQEKDYVIYSAVRAQATDGKITEKSRVGFLADVRRMNVAVTRARLNLWVIGNAAHLQGNPLWKKFVGYCERNSSLFNIHTKKDTHLKVWLSDFWQRMPKEKEKIAERLPQFVTELQREVRIMNVAAH